MNDRPPQDIEALLAGHAWSRALAGGLLAECVERGEVGEAWLQARGSAPREAGAWRAFLGGVARNLRRSTVRGERRRRRREEAVARTEALPSAAELVERAELRRLLVERVLALGEEERTAILLRYFEGLSAEEIARRAGVPGATVRSRLRRGLAHLREGLELRLGRDDLLAGLIALVRDPVSLVPFPAGDAGPAQVAAPGLPLLGGALVMKTLLSVAAACAAVLTLVLGARFLARDTSGRAAEAAPATTSASAVDAPADVLEVAAAVPPDAERIAVEGAHPAPVPAPAAAEPPPRPARVAARVLDAEGRPLAGVSVVLRDSTLAESGVAGRVDFDLDPRLAIGTARLEFTRPGYARVLLHVRPESGALVQLGDVTLLEAAEVRGRVEDERGRPLEGVRVIADALENGRTDPEELRRLGPLEQEDWIETRSGPGGGFVLADVPHGARRVWAGGDDLAWSSLRLPELGEEGARDLVLVLEPLERADHIAGIVLDPHGEPVPGASVYTWFTTSTYGTGSQYQTDADGRFEILLQARVAHDLTVVDAENRWSEQYHFGVEPGEEDLVLAFEEPRWTDVLVTAPSGEPVEDFELELSSATAGNWLRMAARLDERVAGAARLRIPNERFQVKASAPGRAEVVLGPFEPAGVPPTLAFELEALPGVRGVVLSAGGEPVQGARVGLYRLIADELEQYSDGFRTRFQTYTKTRTTTDADGRFVLYPPFAGNELTSPLFVLRAEAPGHAPTELAPRPFDPREGAEIELRLVRGGAIEGRALLAPGVDPSGFLLAFSRGDGEVRTRHLGADGGYREEGLTPGPWEVRALDAEIEGQRSSSTSTYHEGGAPPFENWTCVVVDGETTRHDVDLSERAPATLRGELVLAGGSTRGWTASFEEEGSALADQVLASVPLDDEGRFELETPRGGEHRLVLRGPESEHGRLELRETLDLDPGATSWRLELEVGRLEGAGAQGRGTRERFHAYSWLGSAPGHALAVSLRIVPDASGSFELPCVPAGPGKISRNDPPNEGQEFAPWVVVSEFDVPAGGVRGVVLP